MGTVDIVPGVSGSTVAVLLGFYERFIGALKNINLDLIRAFFGMFRHCFSAESREKCKKACIDADIPWLVNLLLGLGVAFVAASFVIPMLMERYPTIMFGLFSGLVLGSAITPWRDISRWNIRRILIMIVFAIGCFFTMGQHVQAPTSMIEIVADGTKSLSMLCEEAPCFYTPSDVLASSENTSLRNTVGDVDAIIASGTSVYLPTGLFGYCLLAGFCGICAMLLPGISGSFILLVLGCYYFMLHTGKSFLHALMRGEFYGIHLVYMLCFAVGALIGIALFSRLLTYLLKNWRDATLAAIIGILLGCLRAIWPYKAVVDGIQTNVLPNDAAQIIPVVIACIMGLLVVVATLVIQDKITAKNARPNPLTNGENHAESI